MRILILELTVTISSSPEMLTIAQAAEHLNVHKNTIRNLIQRGDLNAVRIGRNIIRIPAAEVQTLATPYVGGEHGVWN
jgi:excisionase family DNA binding protein